MLVKNKKLLLLSVISIVAVVFVLFASPVLAQIDTGLDVVAGETGLGDNDLVTIIGNIIKVFLGVLGIIGILIVLYAGFLYMTSGGNQDQIAKARKMLISALIGLVIILSAYAITAFIIRQLGDATGAGDGTSGNNGCIGTQCLNISGQKVLFAKIIPNEDVPIYNFSVKVVFNYPLTQESVDSLNAGNHVVVSKIEEGGSTTDVEGTVVVVAGNKIAYFTPSEACPAECSGSSSCFDKDSDYSVTIQNPNTIKSTVLDSSGTQLSLYCGEFAPCMDEFGTGDKCDREYPEVILEEPRKNQAYCRGVDYPVNVAVQASDDTALSLMYYVLDSEKTGELALDEVDYNFWETMDGYPTTYTSYFTWKNNLDETEFLTRHTIAGGAIDIADHVYQRKAHTIRLYDPVCCDDDGEFICNDADPRCPKCTGGDCITDDDCVFKCVEGKCVAPAVITNVLPSEGDFGALVTIVGYNFGSYDSAKSKVFFYNDVEADLGCDPTFAWSNDQIIAQVPEGFSTGAIKITTINDETETTSDEDGWIGDFIKNPNVNYPGICEVSENSCGVCQVCKSDSRQNGCLSSCLDLNSEECTTCVQDSCSSQCPGDLFEQNSCARGEAEQTFHIAGQGFEDDGVADVNFGLMNLNTGGAAWGNTYIDNLTVPNVRSGYTTVAINKGEYCAIQTCVNGENESCELGEEGCNCSLNQSCDVEQKYDGITEGYDKDSDNVIDYVCGCFTNNTWTEFESIQRDESSANCEYAFGCFDLDYDYLEFEAGGRTVSVGNCSEGTDNDGDNGYDYTGGYLDYTLSDWQCGCSSGSPTELEEYFDVTQFSCTNPDNEEGCFLLNGGSLSYSSYDEMDQSIFDDLYYLGGGDYSSTAPTIEKYCGCYDEEENKFVDYRRIRSGEEGTVCQDLSGTIPACKNFNGDLLLNESDLTGAYYREKDGNCPYPSSFEDETVSFIDDILAYDYIEVVEDDENCFCQSLQSNPVRFNVLDTVDEPVIEEISPETEAPANQLITIKGKNFLDTAGRVIFVRGEERFDGTIGCEGSGWSNYEITVKIPDDLKVEDGGESVSVVIVVQTTNNLSDTEPYLINDSLPVAGLCRVRPNNGPVRTAVSIVGENLGTNNTIYDIYFSKGTTVVSANEVGVTWNSERIGNVLVPTGVAVGDGEVYLQNDDGRSNSLDFRVGFCSADSCLDGEVCCADGVCKSVTEGCRVSAREVNPSEFAWKISTGILPNIPKVLERTCIYGGANISASPLPSKGLRDACPNELISATFNQLIPMESFNARTCLLDGLPDVGMVCDLDNLAENCECEAEATSKVVIKMCSEVNAEGTSAPCDLDLCCAATGEDRVECVGVTDTCVKVDVDLHSADLPDNNLEYSNADGESCNAYDADCTAKTTVSMMKLQETFIEEDSAKYEPILQARGASKLMPNMWYQVEIAGRKGGEGGIRNAYGYYLPETYKWKFRTAATDCIPDDLAVTPAKGLIEEILGQETYNAYAVLGCRMLGDIGSDWYWDVSAEGDDRLKASFQGHLCIEGSAVSTCYSGQGIRRNYGVYGINLDAIFGEETLDTSDDRIDPGYSVSLETTSDDLVQVSASADFGQGDISQEADLEIDFVDPKVIDFYPICDSACINTQVRAGFNTQMQKSTVEAYSDDDGYLDNVYIFPCTTASCTAFSIPPQPGNFENFVPGRSDDLDLGLALTQNDINYIYSSSAGSQVNRFDINFSNDKLLEPNRSYRVVITNDVKSLTGKRLTDLNYALNSSVPVNCMDGIDNDQRGGIDYSGGYSTAEELEPEEVRTLDYACGCYSSEITRFVSYGSEDEGCSDDFEFACQANGEDVELDPDILIANLDGLIYIEKDQNCVGKFANEEGIEVNNDSFSWTFRTKDDYEVCKVDRVEVDPLLYIYNYSYDRASDFEDDVNDGLLDIPYVSTPFGAPDECSPTGQQLNSLAYDWGWNSANTLVADVSLNTYNPDKPAFCTDDCLSLGSNSLGAVCGDGFIGNPIYRVTYDEYLDINTVQERYLEFSNLGEECDNGVSLALYDGTPCDSGDTGCFERPVSGDGCSDSCLIEPFTNCIDSNETLCCGNGTLDTITRGGLAYNEECDAGCNWELPNGVACEAGDARCECQSIDTACSNGCLKSGSQDGGCDNQVGDLVRTGAGTQVAKQDSFAGIFEDVNNRDLYLQLDADMATGTYTSTAINSRIEGGPVWSSISWKPYFSMNRELPDNGQTENIMGAIDMSENVLLLHMNENEELVDASGNDNVHELYGGDLESVEGVFGNGVKFDSNEKQMIRLHPLEGTSGPDTQITMMSWVKLTNRVGGRVLFNGSYAGWNTLMVSAGPNANESDKGYLSYIIADSYGSGTLSRASLIRQTYDFDLNKWYHVGVTYNSTNGEAKLYINGDIVKEQTFYGPADIEESQYENTTRTMNSSANEIKSIGNYSNGKTYSPGSLYNDSFLNGSLDEVAVFSRVLSEEEIKNAYGRVPGKTNMKFQVRTCESSDCAGEPFVGPDGRSSNQYFETEYDDVYDKAISLSKFDKKQYLQYRTYFSTEDLAVSPTLQSVTASYYSSGRAVAGTGVACLNSGASYKQVNGITAGICGDGVVDRASGEECEDSLLCRMKVEDGETEYGCDPRTDDRCECEIDENEYCSDSCTWEGFDKCEEAYETKVCFENPAMKCFGNTQNDINDDGIIDFGAGESQCSCVSIQSLMNSKVCDSNKSVICKNDDYCVWENGAGIEVHIANDCNTPFIDNDFMVFAEARNQVCTGINLPPNPDNFECSVPLRELGIYECCGNGILDDYDGDGVADEECEAVGGSFPDGCNNKCINQGSDSNREAICGDTRLSAGEDPICEKDFDPADLPTSPYQFATWDSELASKLDRDDANICVGSREGCLFKLISQTFITEARTKINAVVEEDDSRTTGSSDLIYRSNVCKMPAISLESSIPSQGQQNVCRNSLIYITLDGVNADDSFEINLTDNTDGEQNIIFASNKAGNEICSAVLPSDGIIWGLNENIGNKAHDRNGGEEATVYAGVWTDGKYSSAIDFNGTSTYLYSYNTSFDISAFSGESGYDRAKWSVGMWVNPRELASDTHRTLFSASKSDQSDSRFSLVLAGSDIVFTSSSHDDITVASDIYEDIWTHLVFVNNGNDILIYKNGRNVGSIDYNADTFDSIEIDDIAIGAGLRGRTVVSDYFSGIIDEINIFNQELTVDEVITLYKQYDIEPSLDHYLVYGSWPFNGVVNDYGGDEITTVTLGDGISFVDAKVDQGVGFDSTSYIKLNGNGVDSLDFSFASWVKWEGDGTDEVDTWQRIFDFGTDWKNHMYLTPNGDEANNHNLIFHIKNSEADPQELKTVPLETGKWAHVAVVLSGDNGKLYVNGQVKDSKTITLNPRDVDQDNLYFGKSNYNPLNALFEGVLDETRIYKRALSEREIQSLYEQGGGVNSPSCGDNSCNGTETCSSCPNDCGVCNCLDGSDNDSDGLSDSDDPGCQEGRNDEFSQTSECQDTEDNDGDGVVDEQDPGCFDDDGYNRTLDNEGAGTTECQDSEDNDGDEFTDFAGGDPGCVDAIDNNEGDNPACSDRVDNDDDGLVDNLDPGCWDSGNYSLDDSSEADTLPVCSDNYDNDDDGRIDYNADTGCTSATDSDEFDLIIECSDSKDNDGDGLYDVNDPGCWEDHLDPRTYDPKLTDESLYDMECSDKEDNDADGKTDAIGVDFDPDCSSILDDNESDKLGFLAISPHFAWLMDEGIFTNLSDAVNDDYSGTLAEGTWTRGYNDKGIYFDGKNDLAYRNSNLNLDWDNAWTVSLFVKPEALSGSEEAIMSISTADGVNSFSFIVRDQVTYIKNNDSEEISLSTEKNPEISNDQWTQVVYVYDKQNLSLYVNGNFIESGDNVIESDNYEVLTLAGNRVNGTMTDRYQGVLDEFILFDSALGALDVSKMYSLYIEMSAEQSAGSLETSYLVDVYEKVAKWVFSQVIKVGSYLSTVKMVVADFFVANLVAAPVDPYCAKPFGYNISQNSEGQTILTIVPDRLLEKNKEYTVSIQKIKNLCGKTLDDDIDISFTTGSEVCRLNKVWVEPSDRFVTERNVTEYYKAYAMHNEQPIVGFDNIYDWNFAWSSENNSIAQIGDGYCDENGSTFFEADEGYCLDNSDCSANVICQSFKEGEDPNHRFVKTFNKNGKTYVRAKATIETDNLGEEKCENSSGESCDTGTDDCVCSSKTSTVGSWKTGYGNIEVNICDKRWEPSLTGFEANAGEDYAGLAMWHVLNGPDTHLWEVDNNLGLYYCRDFGENVEKRCYDGTPCIQNSECSGIGDELCSSPYVCQDNTVCSCSGSENGIEYCLDPVACAGNATELCSARGLHDDLPNLKIIKPELPTVGATPQCNDTFDNDSNDLIDELDPKCFSIADNWEVPMLRAEYFFVRDDLIQSNDDNSSDVISLRIYDNPEAISPELWYSKYVPNPGTLSSLESDCLANDFGTYCYRAGRTGNSYYVAASNYNGATTLLNEAGDTTPKKVLFNNVYLIGMNENANSATQNIYNQMIETIKFNLNVLSDPSAGDMKRSFVKDLQRTQDVALIKQFIEIYKSNNGQVPQLESGTYVRNEVFSTWPSWQNVFGAELGFSLPVDMDNHFELDIPDSLNLEGLDPADYVDRLCKDSFDDQALDTYCNEGSQCIDPWNQCSVCTDPYDGNTCFSSSVENSNLPNFYSGGYYTNKDANPVYYYGVFNGTCQANNTILCINEYDCIGADNKCIKDPQVSKSLYKLDVNLEGIDNNYYDFLSIMPKRCSLNGEVCRADADCVGAGECNYLYE